MFESTLADLSLKQSAVAMALFFSAPALWALSFIFIRLPKGERLTFVRQRLRNPFFALYLLIPLSIVPAALVWLCLGAGLFHGTSARLAFTPIWLGVYFVLAVFGLYLHIRKKRRP
jgi:hypothetical protein